MKSSPNADGDTVLSAGTCREPWQGELLAPLLSPGHAEHRPAVFN